MVILFYLPILTQFAALFALGFFPVVVPGRRLRQRPLLEAADAWAPVGGMLGTVIGFLFIGLNGLDRFALAPDHVRTVWRDSGSAFVYELGQPLFSGFVSAVALLLMARLWPRLAANQRVTTGALAFLVSFVCFSVWPVILSPFL